MTNKSIVVRLNRYEIEILEEFRQNRIKCLAAALKEEENEIAKSCYKSDIERFNNMTLPVLLTECLRTVKFYTEGKFNL